MPLRLNCQLSRGSAAAVTTTKPPAVVVLWDVGVSEIVAIDIKGLPALEVTINENLCRNSCWPYIWAAVVERILHFRGQ